MPRLAIVTCAEFPALAPDDHALAEALRARGVEPVPCVWDDAGVEWAAFDGALLRSPWDYHLSRDAFVAWAARVGGLIPLWNDPATISWNTEKGYLRRFEAAGIPIVPTAWVEHGAAASLPALLAERGWTDAVVKPAVGLGSLGIVRVPAGDADSPTAQTALDQLTRDGDVLVQPFLTSVVAQGELALIYIDGVFSHAARKRPAAGDYRVQPRWGGSIVRSDASPAAHAFAERVLAELPETPLYARVDLLEENPETPWLTELELVDPALYFGEHPKAADRLADAVARRLRD